MNNAKIWLVVKPTVGIPLFLSAVALSSFAVHLAVVGNTTWIEDYHQGLPLGTGAEQAALKLETEAARVKYMAEASADRQILVVLPDGTTTRAVLAPQVTDAAFDAGGGGAPPIVSQ